ncbi:MAG: hypothetical protein ACRDJE_07135 [Dehalococcoidia bacterium]
MGKVFIQLLQAEGHLVRHARTTAGMSSVTDGHQLLFAAQHGSVLLTHNGKDFLLLHDAWRRWTAAWQSMHAHEGILLIPQHVPVAIVARAVSDRLVANIPLRNEFYEWHPVRGWQYIPYRA